MEWTWHPESGRNHEDWWDPSVYDLMGVDHYVCMDDALSCREDSLLNRYWDRVIAWAAAEGVDLAVGEWGLRGTDQAAGDRVLEWFNHAANSYRTGARIVALSAFDSNANGDLYELKGKQLEMYRALMLDPRTARITD